MAVYSKVQLRLLEKDMSMLPKSIKKKGPEGRLAIITALYEQGLSIGDPSFNPDFSQALKAYTRSVKESSPSEDIGVLLSRCVAELQHILQSIYRMESAGEIKIS